MTNHPAKPIPPSADPDSFFGAEPEEVERKKKRQRTHKREITLNLVATLDMAFQLMFFFCAFASFAEAEGVLTANLPAPGQAVTETTPPPQLPMTQVKLGNNGVTTVISIEMEAGAGKEDVPDFIALTKALELRMQGGILRKDSPIVIVPKGDVAWQDVVNAFNAALNAHLENVAFGSEKHI